MQLDHIFRLEFINGDLRARNKDEALNELVNTVIRGGLKLELPGIIDVLKQRENLGSTGIGDGIAIPHGKIPAIDDIVIAFGRSVEGIPYDSMDGKPVYLFFLLLAPENSAGQHLKILAKISRMSKNTDFRRKLLDAKTQSDLYKIIIDQENISIN